MTTVGNTNPNQEFFDWIKSTGKTGMYGQSDISGISDEQMRMWKQMYGEEYKGVQTQDKMGDLSDSLLDPNSKFYQQYASYLQKTTPGIGANTLLSPLMAGGTGYAGGQAIANQKLQGLAGQRQDKINTGVQGFALGNVGLGANLLGQQANAYGQQANIYGNVSGQLQQQNHKYLLVVRKHSLVVLIN